jgi:alanyl-tRNA synthetase
LLYNTIQGIKFTSRTLDSIPAKNLRGIADSLKQQLGSGVAAVVSVIDGKAALVVSVSKDLHSSLSAVDLVRAGVAELGGKGGGGRPDFAQGGGPNGDRAQAALAAIERALAAAPAAAE